MFVLYLGFNMFRNRRTLFEIIRTIFWIHFLTNDKNFYICCCFFNFTVDRGVDNIRNNILVFEDIDDILSKNVFFLFSIDYFRGNFYLSIIVLIVMAEAVFTVMVTDFTYFLWSILFLCRIMALEMMY